MPCRRPQPDAGGVGRARRLRRAVPPDLPRAARAKLSSTRSSESTEQPAETNGGPGPPAGDCAGASKRTAKDPNSPAGTSSGVTVEPALTGVVGGAGRGRRRDDGPDRHPCRPRLGGLPRGAPTRPRRGPARDGVDPWGPHLIFEDRRAAFGFGGFKGAPVDGEVEVGYAVAPDRQGRGIATTGSAVDGRPGPRRRGPARRRPHAARGQHIETRRAPPLRLRPHGGPPRPRRRHRWRGLAMGATHRGLLSPSARQAESRWTMVGVGERDDVGAVAGCGGSRGACRR